MYCKDGAPCVCTVGEQMDPAAEDLRIQLFRQYLIAEEDEGFEGSFAEFAGEDLATELQLHEEDSEPEIEEVQPHLIAQRIHTDLHSLIL